MKLALRMHKFLLILVCFLSPLVQAQQVHWKIQSSKSNTNLEFKSQRALARETLSEFNGELRLEVLPPNGFVGINESFSATSTGIIDGMFMAPSYWGAADPVFSIIGDLVTAWDSPEQYRKWLQVIGEQLIRFFL